jgi:hypothetical protein
VERDGSRAGVGHGVCQKQGLNFSLCEATAVNLLKQSDERVDQYRRCAEALARLALCGGTDLYLAGVVQQFCQVLNGQGLACDEMAQGSLWSRS